MAIPMFGVWELLVIAFGVIAVLVILILGIKWLKIKVLPGGVKMGEDGKTRPVHADCPHVKDIMTLIARTVEHVELRIYARNELIEEQMKHYEAVWLEVEGKLRSAFIATLSDTLGVKEGLLEHPDYRTYMLVLSSLKTTTGNHVRVAMRLNGLSEKVGLEWSNYIKLKKTGFQQIITNELDIYYFGKSLSRECFYKANYAAGLDKVLEDAVDQVFEHARELAQKVDADLATQKESYMAFLEKHITGVPLE